MLSSADFSTIYFGSTIVTLRHRARISAYRLAELSGVDAPYLSRLERGEKRNPGRRTVARIAYGLARAGLSQEDVDSLYAAAGYLPVLGSLPRRIR